MNLSFVCCRLNVNRSALIFRNLLCPEKFLVTRLIYHGCIYIHFPRIFLFFMKKLTFSSFLVLFWRSIEFLQQNIDQSETGITDKKLLLELYVKIFNHGGHRDLPLSCMEYGWQGLAKFEIFTNLLWRKLKDWDRYLTVCQKVLSMW